MIELEHSVVIAAPALRCFDLVRSVDLHADTSRAIDGRAVAGVTAGLAGAGDRTTWSARFFGLRFRLTTEIQRFEPPRALDDVMCEGRFRRFGHHYRFEVVGDDETRVTDRFFFRSPGWLVGRAFDTAVLRPRMRRLMRARLEQIKRVAESQEWRDYLDDA